MTSALFRSRRTFAFASFATFAAAAITACGSDSTAPVKKDVVAATITPTATDTLKATAGSSVGGLTVTVKNAEGQPIDTATVTFAVVTGGGSLSATSVKTDSTGVATTVWTLGNTAGLQTVTATTGTLSPVIFAAVASAGPAASLTKVAGDNQTAPAGAAVATNPSVKVTDSFGNPVSGVLVTFVPSNSGSVTGGAVNTDANGLATVSSWKLGPNVGPNTLTATANGISSTVSFSANGTVGAVAKVTITSPLIGTLQIGGTATVTAAAFDANNNAVSGATITFSSDNTAVATVNSTTGVVTAVGSGSANISATSNGVSASTPVTVIGHPSANIAASLPQTGRVRNIVIAGTQAYAALGSGDITNVDLGAATQGWKLTLPATPVGVGVNSANTAITAATTNNKLYIISPSTHAIVDSVSLAATPVKMAMTAAGARVFVDESNFQMEIIDVPSRAVVATVPLSGTVTAMKVAAGDTLLYAGTVLGNIMEIDTRTGAVRRNYDPSTTVTDLDVSPDGKTLAVADGTNIVTLVPLAVGGASATIDYGANVSGLAFSPDLKQLWVAIGATVYASPSDGAGSFLPTANTGRITVTGANFTKVAIAPSGLTALAYDDAALNLVVIK